MPLPDDYMAALEQLAAVFSEYHEVTGWTAVLVGGAAAAIYTDGQFPSGDFDIVAAGTDALDKLMVKHGFIPEDRQGYLHVGFYHPRHPGYGFQHVSGALFDGRADRARMVRLAVRPSGEIALPAIEDMIADRLGQYAEAPPSDDSRLRQARALFALAPVLDHDYLQRRVGDEGGDLALLGL